MSNTALDSDLSEGRVTEMAIASLVLKAQVMTVDDDVDSLPPCLGIILLARL